MIYYVYIIYSKSLNKYYVGYTHDINARVEQHNTSCHKFSKFTSRANDWVLKYKEEFSDKTIAIKREKEIKNWRSKKMIEKLIYYVE